MYAKGFILFLILGFAFCSIGLGQNVVVSEYNNESSPGDEWVELLIIDDNTDLRNYSLRDNSGSQTNWTNTTPNSPIFFNNISFWNNLRAGTIIIIWFRDTSSNGVVNPIDIDKSDGFIRVNAMSTTYFSSLVGTSGYTQTGVWGTPPYNSSQGSSFNIASGGDLLQIRTPSTIHVYALGHKPTSPGNDFTSISGNNKLNNQKSISTGDNIFVCPGGSISDFNQGVSGTTYTLDSTNITQGLPNKRTSDSTSNRTYWRSLRQPTYSNPSIDSIKPNSNYTYHTLYWKACTDPNPSDSTTGYIILKNTSNSFIPPSDGVTYTVGTTIGTATVVANVTPSTTTTYNDTPPCGATTYYKIYAFRYGTDNTNGNNYDNARGRAYNETGTNVFSLTRITPTTSSVLSY